MEKPINNFELIKWKYFPDKCRIKVLSTDPFIVKIKNFLSAEEISYLRKRAHHNYKPSTIIHNDEIIESSYRTNSVAYITDNGQYGDYPELKNLYKKICHLVGCNKQQIENLMVVKYQPHEQYFDHHDYFKSTDTQMISDGGQRIASFFIYLNSLDKDAAGETEFPSISLKCRPVAGTAIFWWNLVDGHLQDLTLHRGNPVLSGTKYGLNIWIREHGW